MKLLKDYIKYFIIKCMKVIYANDKNFLIKLYKYSLSLALLFVLTACDDYGNCYPAPTISTKVDKFILRADGLQVYSHSGANAVTECQIAPPTQDCGLYVDLITGAPKATNSQYGNWQKTIPLIGNNSSSTVSATGSVYLQSQTQKVAVAVNSALPVTRDASNQPLNISKGDYVVIKRSGTLVDFQSIGGFDDDYASYIKTSDFRLPNKNETFQNYLMSFLNQKTHANFIASVGYCKNRVPDNPPIDPNTGVPSKYVNFDSPHFTPFSDNDDYFKNCFHYDGRGLTISLNGTTIKDANSPFMGAAGVTSQYQFSNNEQVDIGINQVFIAQEDGVLSFDFDKSFFRNAKYFAGGYSLEVKRYTDKHDNGELILGAIADSGIDLNDVNTDINKLIGEGKVKIQNVLNQTISPARSGYLWLKISDSTGDYKDNLDAYYVEITTIFQQNGWSQIYINFVTPLKKTVYNAVQRIFNRSVTHPTFQLALKLMMVLTLTFYAFGSILGLIQEPLSTLIVKMFKIGLLSMLLHENSWNFFSKNMFSVFLGDFNVIPNVVSGGDWLIMIFQDIEGCNNPFCWMDTLFTKFFSAYMGYKILSFLILGAYGILMIVLIGFTLFKLILVLFRAFIIYCIMAVMTAFLVSLSPIFLCCMLFNKTQQMFNTWWRLTLYTSLQPAFMFMGIIVIAYIADLIGSKLFGTQICYFDVLRVNLMIFNAFKIHLFTIVWYKDNITNVFEYNLGAEGDAANGTSAFAREVVFYFYRTTINAVCFLIIIVVKEGYLSYSEKVSRKMLGLSLAGGGAGDGIDKVTARAKSIAKAIVTGGKSIAMDAKQIKKFKADE